MSIIHCRYVSKIGSLRYPVFGQNIHVARGGVAWVQESVMSQTRMLYKPVLLFFSSKCLYTCICIFRISRELLDCLKVEEAGFTISGIDDKMKVFYTCLCVCVCVRVQCTWWVTWLYCASYVFECISVTGRETRRLTLFHTRPSLTLNLNNGYDRLLIYALGQAQIIAGLPASIPRHLFFMWAVTCSINLISTYM